MSPNTQTLDTTTLENWLWEAACSIRGPLDAPKYKDYILPLLFYKRLSDVYEDEIVRITQEIGDRELARELAREDRSLTRAYIPAEYTWAEVRKSPVDLGDRLTTAVRQVLEDQLTHVKPAEVEAAIESELQSRLTGRTGAILWPKSSSDVPHREPRFLLAYLSLDFASLGSAAQREQALEYLTQYGDQPRRYRNGLGLATPERSQVETLRRATRYLKAIERVRSKRQALNLTTAQMQQLKDRENTEQTACDAAIRNLYQTIWLPAKGSAAGGLEIEEITLAGRPLQARGLHERLMELLTVILPPPLFNSVTPEKIVELMRLGAGEAPSGRQHRGYR